MKTKQEQIEAIAGIIAETLQDKRVENGATWVTYLPSLLGSANKEKEVAEALMQAGYGDVSEYKAEIERLKEKNNEPNKKNWLLEEELKKKELEITYARNNGYEKGYDECEEYMKGKIKQAQINILREFKERIKTAIDTYYDSDEEGEGYFIAEDAIEDIDELIKEVENENQH